MTTARPGSASTIDSYDYNQTGDTTGRTVAGQPGHTLTWDPEDRLASDTAGGQTTSFLYTADGARLLRRDPTHTTLYLPDNTELRCDRNTGAVAGTRLYTHAGRTLAIRQGSTVTWLAADHHNTATFAINATDLSVTRRRTLPFGGPRGTPPVTWPGERGFVGGTTDPTTGLTHLGARDYDPTLGRFISVDPLMDLTDPQQMHGYTYANNNPTTLSDPTGLIPDYCGADVDCYGYGPQTGCPGGCGTSENIKHGQSKGWDKGKKPRPKPKPWADDMERKKKELVGRITSDPIAWDDMVGPDGVPSHVREHALDILQEELCALYPDHCVDIGLEIAAATVWIANPKGLTPQARESADIVRGATFNVLNTQTQDQILARLERGEMEHMKSNPWSVRMWFGHALHRATNLQLQGDYPDGRFSYSPNKGVDFTDRKYDTRVELTTGPQIGRHKARGGDFLTAAYVAYLVSGPISTR